MNTNTEVKIFQPSLNEDEMLLIVDGLSLIAATKNATNGPNAQIALQMAVSVALDQFDRMGVENWRKVIDRLLAMGAAARTL